MSSYAQDIREGVKTAIESDRDSNNFVDNAFKLQEFYLLTADLDSRYLYVSLCVLGWDEERVTRGTHTKGNFTAKRCRREIPIQVSVQKNVDPTNVEEVNTLLQLVEELMMVCSSKVSVTGTTWLRTESVKDENGLPYSYIELRERHAFEATFVAYYQHIPTST